jgi:long-subunit acyl-CoA synthetase (AMP-forming)
MGKPIDPHTVERVLSAGSFLDVFYFRERERATDVFLRQPSGGLWREYTFAQVGDQARRMAAALEGLGVRPGDRVGIISKNCAHWIIADLAILMTGAISVPFYPTLSASSLSEVIRVSGIRVLFAGKLDAWDTQAPGVPDGITRIAFPPYLGNARVTGALEWTTLVETHEPLADAHRPAASEPFTIIYTSGTTGSPKGVVLTYESPRHIVSNEHAAPTFGLFQGSAAQLFSYLPLNHIAERFATEITGILMGSVVSFSESIDRFAHDLRAVQPTLFFAVPRIWTKMREAITAKIPERRLSLLLRVPVLGKLLARALRKAIGLGRAELVISSAAPLPADTLAWFWRLGVPIREVYGMSEVGGGVTVTDADRPCPGTVGKPIPGATIRIDDDTGEVLIRAPWMMTEYFQDAEKTREIMRDGFVHSGDKGRFDGDGNLVITGRITEAFKGAKGRYVLPTGIEARFAGVPGIDQVMVTGRGLPQPLALVCLTADASAKPRGQLEQSLRAAMTAVNPGLDTHERLAGIVVVPAFTVEDGLLTPTLKLRRHAIDARYESRYQGWEAAGGVVFATE